MQTTLLGLAVAVILALVAALVGPLFMDWGHYRSAIESEATRLVGMPVRIAGPIDVRLLPTPYVNVHDITIGTPERGPLVRARMLALELGLGSLIRGEWRAADLHLDAPEIEIGLDGSGNLDVPQAVIGFDPDQLSIERLRIENGRASVRHGRSGLTLTLENISFAGDVRSLVGPFKGEGAFVSAAERYRYRLSAGRRGADGTKMRLTVDPADRPLAVEAEGTVQLDRGQPRFEGTLMLARPVGTALASGKTVVSEPWRATSRVKAGPNSALFEQLEFQYGPDERSIRLAGTAEAKFAPRLQIDAVLSARQIDLDRSLGPSELPRRMPIAVLQGVFATAFEGWHPQFPVKLGIDIDAVTLGGATLQTVRGDLKSESDAWVVDTFEFRAPGLTQVKFGGRVKGTPSALEFTGPASVRSTDPGALVAWLEGRTETKRASTGPLSGRGQLTIGRQRIAVENLDLEFDRKAVAGRFAYQFPEGRLPARLDAALSAAELDIDNAIAFVTGALAGAKFERPRDVALALAVGKAHYAGIEARQAEANLRFDATGLQVERLAIADIGGAVVKASGHVDTSGSPRGALALDLEAQRLDGIAAIAGSVFPQSAEVIRGYAGRLAPAKVSGRIDFEPDYGKSGSTAKLAVDGRLGLIRANVTASGASDAGAILPGNVTIAGRLDAEDGAALGALFGLDRMITLDKRPAHLALSLTGPIGDLRVDGRFAAGGLDSSAAGSIRVGLDGVKSDLDLTVSAADAVILRPSATKAIPVAMRTNLSVAGPQLLLSDVRGHVAGTALSGQVALALASPTRIEGRIAADDIDAAAVLASFIGAPTRSAAKRGATWPAEPFAASFFADLAGRLEFDLTKARLSPALVAQQLAGQARFEPGAIVLENLDGSLGEGRVTGQVSLRRAPVGLSAQGRVRLANADLATLVPGKSLSGRVSLDIDVEGSGLSPASLVGALQGNGALKVDQLQIAGLDPRAIDAAIRASERGLPIERVTDYSDRALDGGSLKIASAGGPVTIANGRARVSDLNAAVDGSDIAFAASYDLLEESFDGRFILAAPPRAEAPGGRQPELSVLFKGPPQAVRRRTDASALINWITLRNVELETKRLEAAEREAKRLQAIEAARRAERERLDQERAERERAERERIAAEKERLERTERERTEERAERERAEKERSALTTAPATTSATSAASVGARAPDLPPPVDIRPVPARPPVRPAKPQAPAPAPAEPTPLLRQMLNIFQ